MYCGRSRDVLADDPEFARDWNRHLWHGQLLELVAMLVVGLFGGMSA